MRHDQGMRLRPSQPGSLLPFFGTMKISKALSIVCLSFLSSLTGCSEQEYGVNNTVAGTVAGSALGAGVGAVVGNQSGNAGAGVAIGAGAGALGGALIGAQGDAQRHRTEDQEERLRRQERELERQRREIEELKRSRQYDSDGNPKTNDRYGDFKPSQPSYSNDSAQRDPDDPIYRDNRDDRLYDDTDDDFKQDL